MIYKVVGWVGWVGSGGDLLVGCAWDAGSKVVELGLYCGGIRVGESGYGVLG